MIEVPVLYERQRLSWAVLVRKIRAVLVRGIRAVLVRDEGRSQALESFALTESLA